MLLDLRSLAEATPAAAVLPGSLLSATVGAFPGGLLQYHALTAPVPPPPLAALDWWRDAVPPPRRPLRSPPPDLGTPLASVEIAPVLSWTGTWPDRLPRPIVTLASGAPFLGIADPEDWLPALSVLLRPRPRALPDASRLNLELVDLGLTWAPTLPERPSRRLAAAILPLSLPSAAGTADPLDWLPAVAEMVRRLVGRAGASGMILNADLPAPALSWIPTLPAGVLGLRRVLSPDPSLTTWEVILAPPVGPVIVIGVVAVLGSDQPMTLGGE